MYQKVNYSNLINRASSYVKTKYFIQLNNDIQAIHAGWIEQMQGWFNIPGVKIVGANLYYPNSKHLIHYYYLLPIYYHP